MPFVSRQGSVGNLPGWNGVYCEFRSNPIGGKRTAGDPTGTAGDRNLIMFTGHGKCPALTLEHNPKGTQTILMPVVAAGGLDLGSQDQTADDGMELHLGAETQALGAGQFVSRTTPYTADFLDIVIADVSGSDDLAFGLRKIEAAQAGIDTYTDFIVLNVITGAIKQESALADAATVTTDLGVAWADAAKKSLRVQVDGSGNASVFYSTDAAFDSNGLRQKQAWTSFGSAVAYQLADALNMTPFMFVLQDTDILGVATIRAIEWGVGYGS